MANYLSLEEAAKKLGVPADRLVELRSQGQVRGFRDGASWKFPENEIERLADELGDVGGSDLGIGGEPSPHGSDVNLIPSDGAGSDVAVVAGDSDSFLESGSDLLEIDSAELQLNDPAIMHDSAQLDLAIEPNAGSTGPVTDAELKEISESHPDVLAPEPSGSKSGSGSMLELGGESDDLKLNTESDLSFPATGPDEDSGEELLGVDDDSAMDVLGSDIEPGGSSVSSSGVSSLELMGDLDEPSDLDVASMGSRSADVLSELDLLGAEQSGSGLISGDSGNMLGSGVGSGVGSGLGSGFDDALADDDELVIADDDDDLVISGAGSDISVAGDSGINLMSPSDSGLSLESEPLDLAGSSISALDLGAELSEGGSSGSGGRSGDGSGSMVDFQADEEFQLSPSGIGLDADFESGSQVIEVEDSEAIGEPVEFGEPGIVEADPLGGDVFGAEPEAADALGTDEEGIAIDESATAGVPSTTLGGYEVPFSLMQCIALMLVLCFLSLGGMLMTDLVRNMWTYSEPAAPVSSLTDSLIAMMGWEK